jgi:short-subunit dehydrogenase
MFPRCLPRSPKADWPAATKSLAIEYANKGIRVNAVAPGLIKTPMHAPETHEFLAKLHPVGRMGEVRDIVDATNAAWRTKPTFYAVSTQDRTINPDLERFMAKRMGAKTIEIEASQLALISHPDAITNLILEALAV